MPNFQGFEEGYELYSKALYAFMKKQSREAFMVPTTNEGKMAFLKVLLQDWIDFLCVIVKHYVLSI